VALVAVGGAPEEAMGVARAVRLELEPDVYEVAVTVVDACQRRGLGSLLLERLTEAVVERGGVCLRFCVLPSNEAMQGLLHRAAPGVAFVDDAGLLRLDLWLGRSDGAAGPAERASSPLR
jgi:ribosomal protein S18 acetylase RimI-like enzyme